jgi:threonine aldolase
MTSRRDEFASDNTAGICPEALAAVQAANHGAAPAYGDDRLTSEVRDRIREIFECNCDVYLVFNGTAANALALAQMCQPFHSIICHRLAHIHTDECGAPEFFTGGSKLLLMEGKMGKIVPHTLVPVLAEQHGVHSHKPRVLSITQTSELGTVYSPEEIRSLSDFARQHDLLVHMDGARLANALAFLNCSPREVTWEAGVDVLCFGGTKNGIASGELVVFFDRELARDFDYRVKQGGQLGSKMRFLAAQWQGLLTNDVWLRNARRANESAQQLANRIHDQAGVEPVLPVQSNSVFLQLSSAVVEKLGDRGWNFYKMVEPDIYRLMCSWATSDNQITEFVREFKDVMSAGAG